MVGVGVHACHGEPRLAGTPNPCTRVLAAVLLVPGNHRRPSQASGSIRVERAPPRSRNQSVSLRARLDPPQH